MFFSAVKLGILTMEIAPFCSHRLSANICTAVCGTSVLASRLFPRVCRLVQHRRGFSAMLTPSAPVGKRNHSDWLFSLANQCMRSETEVKKANTDGYYFSFSSTAVNMFSISRYVKQSVMDESENGTHAICCLYISRSLSSSLGYHAVRLPVVASFE